MKHSHFLTWLSIPVLMLACQSEKKKTQYYHSLNPIGVCSEWVLETVDPQDLPSIINHGACPQEAVLKDGVKAYRYANCPLDVQDGPSMMVFYSWLDGDDMTKQSAADICKVFDD